MSDDGTDAREERDARNGRDERTRQNEGSHDETRDARNGWKWRDVAWQNERSHDETCPGRLGHERLSYDDAYAGSSQRFRKPRIIRPQGKTCTGA